MLTIRVLPALLCVTTAVCSVSASNLSAPAPKSGKAHITLHNVSFGQRVKITSNGKVVWDAAVSEGGFEPIVHRVELPLNIGDPCTIRVSGGQYKTEFKVDWKKGQYIIVEFERMGVRIGQLQQPPRFL